MENFTPEEIGAMIDRVEGFSGKEADFRKLSLYREILGNLTNLLDICTGVYKITEFKPNPSEQNSVICLDVEFATALNPEQVTLLTEAMRKADRVVLSATKTRVRISFGVENVWKD